MSDDKVWTASTGTRFTDADIERWASDIEAGHLPGRPGPVTRGRPLAVGAEPAEPVTIRLDRARRDKLARLAKSRHVSKSQVIRELLDQAAN